MTTNGKRKLFIVDIEPLDNRYTKQWKDHIPTLAKNLVGEQFDIIEVSGKAEGYNKPQAGAFFDFAATCEYKASQAYLISRYFQDGLVCPDDVFFFTDAWNQTIHTVKYISELNDIPVKCAGIWHAGWYDPTDILGLKIKSTRWAWHLESSMFEAYDMNFFGTQQHLDKFLKVHRYIHDVDVKRTAVCGYPLEWISALRNNNKKENIVVFPHRLNEDKAPWIFDRLEDLVTRVRPDIKFAKTQTMNMSKDEYYEFLKKCKVVFSANKHENLGIGTFEAMSAGCLPIVPNKLSYQEMYSPVFKYDLLDTDLYSDFGVYEADIAKMIIEFIDNYESINLKEQWLDDVVRIQHDFFSGDGLFEAISLL